MTNRNMVAGSPRAEGRRRMPQTNPTPRTPVPAPESEPQVWTTQDPLDSPQVKPHVRPKQAKSLCKP
jgi:hypothetical protein